jgi:hypothetical protein
MGPIMSGLRFGGVADVDEHTTTAIIYPVPASQVVVNTITGRQVDLGTGTSRAVGTRPEQALALKQDCLGRTGGRSSVRDRVGACGVGE